MQIDTKMFLGVSKMESYADPEQADVSNEMGAGVGSSGSIYIKVRWLYDAYMPFGEITRVLDADSIPQEIEVSLQFTQV